MNLRTCNHPRLGICPGQVDRFRPHDGTSTAEGAAGAFPEELFPPSASRRSAYLRQVRDGYRAMRGRRVVIAGLARDLQGVLGRTIQRIERIAALFDDYRVVIYENDSRDATPWMLRSWTLRNPRVHVVSERRDAPENPATRCLERAKRMAYYRHQCQRVVADRFSHFDSVMLVDMDLQGGWSQDGVAHTYAQDDWDFVGAYGVIFKRRRWQANRLVHYDAWAYRTDDRFTPLSTKQVNHLLFERAEPLQPVTSCFGGLGVYRMAAYLAGRYDGSDVEHVTFHRSLWQQGFRKIYLNPSMIALYGRKTRTWDPAVRRVQSALSHVLRRETPIWYFDNATGNAATFNDPPATSILARPAA